MKNILTLIAFVIVFTVKSQTIVNTYDLVTPIDSIWSVTSELQGTFAAGNGVFTTFNSGLGLGRKLNNKTEAWFLGGYNSAWETLSYTFKSSLKILHRFQFQPQRCLQEVSSVIRRRP